MRSYLHKYDSVRVLWSCHRTDLILGSSHIGGDSAFLLLGAHLPLPAALGGAYRWHAHGGRSLILWRRRQHTAKRNAVTVCAPQEEAGLGVGRKEYYPHLFRGFSEFCLWRCAVNELGVYSVMTACITICLSKYVCVRAAEKTELMSRRAGGHMLYVSRLVCV